MLETEWNGHTIKVKGDWTARWLFLCVDYEMWLDDEKLDRVGGPLLSPKLEAVVEDEEGIIHHLQADLVSIIGFKPVCEISVEGDVIEEGRVRVSNFLNPFLVISIVLSVCVMLWVGPDVLRQYF